MRFSWNVKADSVSMMILWMGSLIAALICVAWLAKNMYPEHIVVQQLDNELSELQRTMNTACRMDSYWKNYYPKVNEGNLFFLDMQACIDSSRCKVMHYANGANISTTGSRIVVEGAMPCANIDMCNAVYYDSGSAPFFSGTQLIIDNATTCEDKRRPITRCRLLVCQTGLNLTLSLESITYINITKQAGVYRAQAQ